MAWYSTSADDQESAPCFFVFHDIGEPPRVTRKPVRECLGRRHTPNKNHNKQILVNLNRCAVIYLVLGFLSNAEELPVQLPYDFPWVLACEIRYEQHKRVQDR